MEPRQYDDLVKIVCPQCQTDLPDWDLHHFVRIYDGDFGWDLHCPRCGATLHWQFRVVITAGKRPRGARRTWRSPSARHASRP